MLNFFIGLMMGGCIATCCMCLMQLNRVRDYENRLEKLGDKLNENDEQNRY